MEQKIIGKKGNNNGYTFAPYILFEQWDEVKDENGKHLGWKIWRQDMKNRYRMDARRNTLKDSTGCSSSS